MQPLTVLILLVTVQLARPENVGWKGYLRENTEEFHDLPLTWEEDIASIPSWLSGTYIRNGPAQVEYTLTVSSSVRTYNTRRDGYFRLASEAQEE